MHVFVSMIIENAKVIAPPIQYITTIDVKGIWGFFLLIFSLFVLSKDVSFSYLNCMLKYNISFSLCDAAKNEFCDFILCIFSTNGNRYLTVQKVL